MIQVCRKIHGHHLHLVWAIGSSVCSVHRIPDHVMEDINQLRNAIGMRPLTLSEIGAEIIGIVQITHSGFKVGNVYFQELNGALELILVQESVDNLLHTARAK